VRTYQSRARVRKRVDRIHVLRAVFNAEAMVGCAVKDGVEGLPTNIAGLGVQHVHGVERDTGCIRFLVVMNRGP
jgi:hypothetical protein